MTTDYVSEIFIPVELALQCGMQKKKNPVIPEFTLMTGYVKNAIYENMSALP